MGRQNEAADDVADADHHNQVADGVGYPVCAQRVQRIYQVHNGVYYHSVQCLRYYRLFGHRVLQVRLRFVLLQPRQKLNKGRQDHVQKADHDGLREGQESSQVGVYLSSVDTRSQVDPPLVHEEVRGEGNHKQHDQYCSCKQLRLFPIPVANLHVIPVHVAGLVGIADFDVLLADF